MSPYLHFGNISSLEVALRVREHASEHKLVADEYLEELIVRRELAFNFARHTPPPYALECLPDWVRARGLAGFLMIFFGGMSLGSAFWGWIANLYSITHAMYAAALGAVIFMLLTCRVRLQQGGELDLTPALHWPDPIVNQPVDFDQGPVMVTICYQVKPQDKQAFLRAIHQLKEARMRLGAYRWGIFENTEKPGHYLEYFMEDNWAGHLRHHDRIPKQDKILQDQILAFHVGEAPPKVTHYVFADMPTKI
jgi:hypothetical protein